MPHSIWKGNISFGLVNIPVGLYPAEEGESKLKFNLIDKSDLSPVGYKRINKKTGKEVGTGDLVKGYEYDEDKYVVLTDEDFKRANVKATQTIEITDFIDASKIHPVYYEKPYFLAPVGKGQKSYALLREVLKKTGKAGIARVVIHSREYIGVLIPYGRMLVLNLMRFADEIKSPEEFELPSDDLKEIGVSEKELDMAEKLVEGMIADWEPAKYHDTYREDILSYIKQKIETGQTETITEAPPPSPKAEVIDLMSLLKKSVEKAGAGRERRPPKKAAG